MFECHVRFERIFASKILTWAVAVTKTACIRQVPDVYINQTLKIFNQFFNRQKSCFIHLIFVNLFFLLWTRPVCYSRRFFLKNHGPNHGKSFNNTRGKSRYFSGNHSKKTEIFSEFIHLSTTWKH